MISCRASSRRAVWRLLWCAAVLVAVAEGTGADVREELPSAGFSRQRSLRQAGIITTKIIGGEDAEVPVPFIVSLRYPRGLKTRSGQDFSLKHFCGGALIADDIVITAAHCIKPSYRSKPIVHIGRLARVGDTEDFEEFQVVESIPHPKHNFGATENYDVALLKLDRKSTSDTISIKRDEDCFEKGGCNKGTVWGWGYTESGKAESISDSLQFAEVKLISRAECKKVYGRDKARRERITETMICAGEPGVDACQKDSGGPLLIDDQLVGIVSWGRGCGVYPGVYASLPFLMDDWLDNEIKKMKGEKIPSLSPSPSPSPPPPPPSPSPPKQSRRPKCRYVAGRLFPSNCRG